MRLKVVKIEPAIRDARDFLKTAKSGIADSRAKYANQKIQVRQFHDTIVLWRRSKNLCATCQEEAIKIVHYANGLMERYCDSCLNRYIDLDKMKVRAQVLAEADKIKAEIDIKQKQ